jgi:hypothetical protein
MAQAIALQSLSSDGSNLRQRTLMNVGGLLDLDVLTRLRNVFCRDGSDEATSLTMEEFIDTIQEVSAGGLTRAESERLYMMIDVNNDRNVDWHEFTSFLIYHDQGTRLMREHLARYELHKVLEQQGELRTSHRTMIEHIVSCEHPNPVLLTSGRDGAIKVWNATDLRQLHMIPHYDKSKVRR